MSLSNVHQWIHIALQILTSVIYLNTCGPLVLHPKCGVLSLSGHDRSCMSRIMNSGLTRMLPSLVPFCNCLQAPELTEIFHQSMFICNNICHRLGFREASGALEAERNLRLPSKTTVLLCHSVNSKPGDEIGVSPKSIRR